MKLDWKFKLKLGTAAISAMLFVLLLVLLNSYQVAAIGPAGTEIGFSGLNGSVRDALGVNLFWYDFTELFGLLALAVCGVFGLTGLMQLLKNRSLKQVDPQILALGVFYVLVIGCYVLFEVVVVNYRPVLMDGALQPEASFPSSHTMLICCVMGSAAMVLKHYVQRDALRMGLQAGCVIIAVVTVVGRLLSGVHWMTDIVGGVLLSCALLGLFAAACQVLEAVFPRE